MSDDNHAYVTPYYKAAPLDTRFQTEFKPVLVESEDHLHSLLDPLTNVVVGTDTETNTLDYAARQPIVGFSWSTNGYDGYYCPLRHQYGRNLPLRCLNVWHEFCRRNKTLWYQTAFDLQMMHNEGFDVSDYRALDMLVVIYNLDNNIVKNNLKWAAEHYLGRPRRTFAEVAGEGARFDLITPIEGLPYAAADPADVYAIYERLLPKLKEECPQILMIDNKLSRSMLFYNNATNTIDSATMRAMAMDVRLKIREVEQKVFKEVGYPFRLDANRDISQALLHLGIDTGERTKNKDMKVDKHSLARIKHPVINLIIERNSLHKQLTSYIEKFTHIDEGRFQLMTCRVPTGRLASGGDKKNPYFLPINSQNFTKTSSTNFRVEPDTSDESILGYKFIEQDAKAALVPGVNYAEGQSSYLNIRRAITVPNCKEWYYVAIDFVQEELMLMGMRANEPVLLDAFRTGADTYAKLAISMWGEQAYNRDRRKRAKQCALSLNYLGTEWTLHKYAPELTLAECKEVMQTYWATLWVMKRWQRQRISAAYQRGGIAYTAYGRPRRLAYWLSHTDWKQRAFGERSVISHEIQGTAGDVMRLAMIQLEKDFFSIYPEDLRFSNAVHDELDLCVRKDAFDTLIPQIAKAMCLKVPGCELPLKTEVSVGYSYGEVFAFDRKAIQEWEPVYIAH